MEQLLLQGARVVVVDDLSTGDIQNLSDAKYAAGERLQFIPNTVTHAFSTLNLERFDEIYHLAAAVGVRLIVDHARQSIETNILETSAAIRWAIRDHAKLLIASSSEVYGKGIRIPFSECDDVVFGPTTSSRWSYGYSKALDEFLTLAAVSESKLQAVIVRFFNTVGPRQKGDWGMVLPRFIQAALAGKSLEVHGDGSQKRCFCDVRDVAPALIQLLRSTACLGHIFNMGSYEVNSDMCFKVESESLINTEGDSYFLLAIDDFYTVEHKTNDSYVQCLAKILIKHHDHKIIFDDGYTVLSNEIVFAQPVDLKQVRVRLLDAYGEPLDLHHNNLSISLEIKELMNVQLYDSYRTQTWTKAEPQAGIRGQSGPWSETGQRKVQHTSGSANAIAYPGRNFN